MAGPSTNARSDGDNEVVCRICLDDADEDSNPLLTPCKCIGSVRFIHLDCLRSWLDQKKQCQYEEGVLSYYWEELTCELCKKGLDLKSISGGDIRTLHYLLSIEKPESGTYCVLESYIECLSKAIHVVDFSFKKSFEVGRRVTNDITVSDISVSRRQSKLRLLNGKIYLEDQDSKFGTFVMLNDMVAIDPKHPLPI